MRSINQILVGAILLLLHFLQTPEGQAILATTENEVIAELEAVEAAQGGTTSPPPTQQPTQQPPPTPVQAATAGAALFNPRKRSSAAGEQQPTEG